MKLKIKNEEELLLAFSDKLAGYQPGEDMNVKNFEYPVTFELDKENKTFKLYKEPVKVTEIPSSEETKKCPYCPLVIGLLIVLILLTIFF